MRDTLRALRDLQELDEDLFRVRRELARLPEERARRREGIDAKIQRRAELQAEVARLRAGIKEIEDDVKIARQRILKVERQSAATRGDQALLAAYSHEVRNIKREISENDDEGLQLVEKAEALDREVADLTASIDAEEEEFAEYDANVQEELATAQAKADGLDAQRNKRLSSDVPPDVLTRYEKLLDAREGLALAALEGRTCQCCYMEVPPNVAVRLARGSELVECPNCQRILYAWGD